MRIAIIGAGWAAEVHAACYANMSDTKLVGIASRSANGAKRLADKLKVPAATDLSTVLRDESVDAVDVCVPSGAHRAVVVAALEHKKHVFTETPFALTLKDADAMIRAAKANDRILAVAQVMKFVVPHQTIHDAVAAGELGPVRTVSAARLSAPYWSREKPRDFTIYGEPMIELMIFEYEYLDWLLGPPKRVSAIAVRGTSGTPEHAWVNLQYERAIAGVEGSAAMPRSHPFTTYLRVTGDSGAIETRSQFTGGEEPETTLVKYGAEGKGSPILFEGQDPYSAECAYFVRCVEGDADPALIDAASGREALRIALAARKAAETGRALAVG